MTANNMSLWELLGQGGLTMAPLYFCSLVAVAVFVRKFIEFRSAGVGRFDIGDQISGALAEGDYEAVADACRNDGTPLGRVMASAAQSVRELPARAQEEAGRIASNEIQRLEAYLPLLSFVAQVAPLFGLLGTVIGMVDLFSGLESAGQSVDASTLSSGIWKALLTTAAGLIIAIPAMGGHAWLTSQVDLLKLRMRDGTSRIFNRAFGASESA